MLQLTSSRKPLEISRVSCYISSRLLIITTDSEAFTRFDDFSSSIPLHNIQKERSTASISTTQLVRNTSRLRIMCYRIHPPFFFPSPTIASEIVDGLPEKQQHARPIITVASLSREGRGHVSGRTPGNRVVRGRGYSPQIRSGDLTACALQGR